MNYGFFDLHGVKTTRGVLRKPQSRSGSIRTLCEKKSIIRTRETPEHPAGIRESA
jgi:hypothetical protein